MISTFNQYFFIINEIYVFRSSLTTFSFIIYSFLLGSYLSSADGIEPIRVFLDKDLAWLSFDRSTSHTNRRCGSESTVDSLASDSGSGIYVFYPKNRVIF